jgi:4-hydroxybenzoate polyprenyltransferase
VTTPLRRLRGFALACHAAPTIGVTGVMTVFAWSLGWSGASLALLAVTILVGQLSVGWSNDAYDSGLDARSARVAKPTVAGDVSPRALWVAAFIALAAAIPLSVLVAGLLGGAFHLLALAMAWLYNLRLSRTAWSWLPYAVAFAAAPPFLTLGLDDRWPPLWMIAAFALIAVSAHLANALPDLAADRDAGLGGLAVHLGERTSTRLCWLLLTLGTGVVAAAMADRSLLVSVALIAVLIGAALVGRRLAGRATAFNALLAVVALDVIAIAILPVL